MTDNSRSGNDGGAAGKKEALSVVIADRIRADIAAGRYPVGSRLPPEPAFAAQLGVARSTLREGLKLLERDGLVLRRQRAGTTVTKRPTVDHPLQRNGGVSNMIEDSGKKHGVVDAQIRVVDASTDVAAELELEENASVVVLERTRTADGVPVVRTIDHLDAAIVESASASLLPDVSFYDWLHRHCGISIAYGVAHLSADTPSAEIAASLGVDVADPVFVLRQVDYSTDGRPVLHSAEYHVGHAFDVTVVRNGPYGG